jgi:hypothetical protein
LINRQYEGHYRPVIPYSKIPAKRRAGLSKTNVVRLFHLIYQVQIRLDPPFPTLRSHGKDWSIVAERDDTANNAIIG